jgi:hypothetical protein
MQTQKVWHAAMRAPQKLGIVFIFLASSAAVFSAERSDTKQPVPVKVEQIADDKTHLSLSLDPAPKEPAAAVTISCPAPLSPRTGAFEVGASYGVLFPSGLVGATQTLPTLSFVLGAPLLGHTVQAQIDYGSTTTVHVLILELNLRWAFDSPFLNSYFITGAHYLNQESDTVQASSRAALGLTAGLGLAFDLGRDLEAHFDLKGFVQNRTTILVGGGFSVLF